MNILICGSQKFDDEAFVFHTLDTFYQLSNGNITNVITSQFSGACQFAENWTAYTNEKIMKHNAENNVQKDLIQVKHYLFDEHLLEKNHTLYEDVDLPPFALEQDSFFEEGKNLLKSQNVQLVLAFPNEQGVLGPSTHNIMRFSKLADIKTFDCSDLLKKILASRKQVASNLMETNEEFESSPKLKM